VKRRPERRRAGTRGRQPLEAHLGVDLALLGGIDDLEHGVDLIEARTATRRLDGGLHILIAGYGDEQRRREDDDRDVREAADPGDPAQARVDLSDGRSRVDHRAADWDQEPDRTLSRARTWVVAVDPAPFGRPRASGRARSLDPCRTIRMTANAARASTNTATISDETGMVEVLTAGLSRARDPRRLGSAPARKAPARKAPTRGCRTGARGSWTVQRCSRMALQRSGSRPTRSGWSARAPRSGWEQARWPRRRTDR